MPNERTESQGQITLTKDETIVTRRGDGWFGTGGLGW